jgi:hypothetical protein
VRANEAGATCNQVVHVTSLLKQKGEEILLYASTARRAG